MPNRWFVVNCKPGNERTVHTGLTDLGIRDFYPIRRAIISHAGKKSEVERPYYPLYTFANFDRDVSDWGKILRLRGVNTILGVRASAGKPTRWSSRDRSGQPQPMPIGIVEELMQLSEISGGSMPMAGDIIQPLAAGTKVTITEGAFAGFGALVSEDHKIRVKVLLDIFGRETTICLKREALALQNDAIA